MIYIITADDLGISPGINFAIKELASTNSLTHTSWMVNTDYFQDSYDTVVSKFLDLNVGLHLNLTYSEPVSQMQDIPLLVDNNGKFKNSFLYLLTLNYSSQKNDFFKQVKIELGAQIKKAMDCRSALSHIDGHWHVQSIPAIYLATKELADKYKIKRIRTVNENFIQTFIITKEINIFNPKRIAKYLFFQWLRKVNFMNGNNYLFSILYNTEIRKEYVRNICNLAKYKNVEIMLHPGNTEIDYYVEVNDKVVNDFIKSEYRDIEFEACMQLNFLMESYGSIK